MDPFAQDQISFAQSIARLFDPSRIIVRSFVGAPVNGVLHPDLLTVSTLAAFGGADVLIISDWGVGRVANDPDRATLADWERSATAVLKLGRAAVLTPYPAVRWPKVCHPRLAMIYWHEKLTVSQVRHAFERSSEQKQ